MNCHRRNRTAVTTATMTLLAAFTVACSDPVEPNTINPGTSALAKGGNPGGGETPGADVRQGDLALADGDAPALVSTCSSGGFAGNGWAVVFGKSGCLLAPTLWASSTYPEYKLVDDVVIGVQIEKGKNGRITHVRLNAQDVDGAAGIWHTTDWIPVAQPVIPSKAGFTLHVHARNVEVWRTDSHLGGGNRVEMIGTISIGDIAYPTQ